MRSEHPAWGGRKIRTVLRRHAEEAGKFSFSPEAVPAASTITTILRRRGQLREEDTSKATRYERLEKERPRACFGRWTPVGDGAFRRYGLPRRIITSGRGAPWGVGMARPDGGPFYTRLSAWLMRLGVSVSFTARAHPQTNGKNERFNHSLGAEAGLRFESCSELPGYQERSPGGWRDTYNPRASP
ncbi:MAG: hypothetical protein BRD38_05640 [Bacteroidetes bacterium QH_9_67_14]|nr:MAG: hypothetical protein BRD38_05640 [Bacteroidetes bacterium QH_9_67_14]